MDIVLDFEVLRNAGAILGSGGIIAADEDTCVVDLTRALVAFCQYESCGKCFPCRMGMSHLLEVLERICGLEGEPEDLDLMRRTGENMQAGSLCGHGQLGFNPVSSALRYFPDEFEAHILETPVPYGHLPRTTILAKPVAPVDPAPARQGAIKMPDDITITIDGVEVATQPGKMVLEAAIDAGIYVPYLCYHPGMKPYAACRMCVVEVEGQRGYPAACTLPVADGMVVRNQNQEVDQLRKSVMEMLIAEHPNGCLTCHRIDICGPNDVCLRHVSVNDRCVTCPKNERCELKDTVRYLGMNLESPLGYKYRNIPLEVSDPFYDRDYNLCIVCGRCVRACEELRGDDAIGFTEAQRTGPGGHFLRDVSAGVWVRILRGLH